MIENRRAVVLTRYPTVDEMNAIQLAARRARARQMKLMLLVCVRGLKSLAARLSAVPAGKRLSHA